jgi:hypothetical protein
VIGSRLRVHGSRLYNFDYRTEIKNKIQNDLPKFSLIDSITDISVASDFTAHQ